MLWSQIYQETKPTFDPETIRKAKRPQLVDIEDVSQDLAAILQENAQGTANQGVDKQNAADAGRS